MPTRVYVDTSAAAKLFVAEQESPALRRWLGSQPQPQLISSALLAVELIRVLSLARPAAIPAAERFLAQDVDIVEITPPVLSDAVRMPPPRLRTLDAIHLATAFDLGPVIDLVLSYDKLLTAAARNAGLETVQPGAA
jgi:uncharacterized protein